jgi:hypothetical protein
VKGVEGVGTKSTGVVKPPILIKRVDGCHVIVAKLKTL